MRNAIFLFELKSWAKSPLFYLFGISFFMFSWVTMLGTGGYFDGPTSTYGNVKLMNNAYALSSFVFLLSKFILIFLAIFASFSLFRDYSSRTHSILYSFPITKRYYLMGKYMSSILAIVILTILTYAGLVIGEFMLGVENPKIASFNVMAHAVALGVYLLPTAIIIGTFVFVAVGFTRNIFAGFVIVIGFALFQLILENTLFNHRYLLSIMDPFGQNAFMMITEDWNIDLQNSNSLPIGILALANRLFWTLAAMFALVVFYRKFDFQYNPIIGSKKKMSIRETKQTIQKVNLMNGAQYNFNFSGKIKSLFYLIRYDTATVLSNGLFLSMCILGVFVIFFIQLRVSNTGEFNLLPVTRIFLGGPLHIYTVILTIGTFLFVGMLMNRAKSNNMNHLIHATAIQDWQLIFSKIVAMSLIHIVQLVLFVMVCLCIQIWNGYYNFELGLTFFHICILVFPVLFVWNVTSHFVHALFPNLFLGLFVLGGLWLGSQSLDQIGINTNLLRFNSMVPLEYSDLNGYGSLLKGQLLLVFYWSLFGILFIICSFLVVIRGSISSIKERSFQVFSRLNFYSLGAIFVSGFLIAWTGSNIYDAEKATVNISNEPNNLLLDSYKSEWERYNELPQPKVVNIDLQLDIFPVKKRFEARATYQLVNKTLYPIDTILIRTGFDEITEIHLDEKAKLIKNDEELKSSLFDLNEPIQPGDTTEISFSILNTPNTLFRVNSNVLLDGTFMKHDILPRIGYQFYEVELPLNDSLVSENNYYYRDADYLDIKTQISTSKNQIAVAPGKLISKEKERSRIKFTYQTTKPIKFNFSFHSCRYVVLEDTHQELNMKLMHKKGHHHNTDLMMAGLKASLDFNTELFGAYPFQEIRVLEFPRTVESYTATLTSNNIPTSEIVFTINSEAMADKIILPFYVMAHELTHEWFGNQVMPADAEGAKMLTESITEYISLNIYRDYWGDEMAEMFIQAQHKRYHNGKKRETAIENPLYKVKSEQQYIAYGKGAIVLENMATRIGREKFHNVLKAYIFKYRNLEGLYPTTLDFIELLKEYADNKHHDYIDNNLMSVEPL